MAESDPYLENQVLTATPEQLHLMVIDGAIRFARQAAVALQNNEMDTARAAIERSRDFVGELLSGLNPAVDRELIADVGSIFLFVFRQLSLVEVDRDPQQIRDAISILEMHRETWLELMQKQVRKPHFNLTETLDEKNSTPSSEQRSWSA